jgi:hypothetical protein
VSLLAADVLYVRQKIKLKITVHRSLKIVAIVLALAVVAGACALGYLWTKGRDRSTCCLQLRNYNQAIASCGIDPNAGFSWRDINATEDMVSKNFQLRLPECPAGGRVSLEFGRGFEGRWQPRAVCSKEKEPCHICPGVKMDESVKDKSGRFEQR